MNCDTTNNSKSSSLTFFFQCLSPSSNNLIESNFFAHHFISFSLKGFETKILVSDWLTNQMKSFEPNLCPSYVFQQGHTVPVQFDPLFRRPLWLLLAWPFELSISFWKKSIICSVEFWVLIKKWRIKLKYLRVWYPTIKASVT